MKLHVEKRDNLSKSSTNVIRRNGDIPGIFYSEGKKGTAVVIKGDDFSAALRKIKKGGLSTAVFTLEGLDGKEAKAIVKGIQYHTTTYDVIHVDLMQLHDDVKVRVNVPIRFKGAAECAGVKQGGVIRQVIRALQVECLPKDLPEEFFIDVKDIALKQSKRLKDIAMEDKIRPIGDLKEVAVTVAKR